MGGYCKNNGKISFIDYDQFLGWNIWYINIGWLVE